MIDSDYMQSIAARFGPRLRELRHAAALTQVQLAERIGVPQTQVLAWERGKKSPTWASVIRLAHVLGVTTDAFSVAPGPKKISEKNPKRD